MSQANKQIFVVLGMARTGTSVISRSLKALGVCHGPALMQAALQWNPKGFWEDKDIVYGVHREIFSSLQRDAYEVRYINDEDQNSEKLNSARDAAIAVLQKRFATTERYAFKDPATTRLITFWKDIFTRLQIETNYVIALRHPLACARSYQKLLNCEMEIGLFLWCSYMMQAIDSTQRAKRVVIDYNQMLQAPRAQLQRMTVAFGISNLDDAEAARFSQEFLESKLDRYGTNDDEFLKNSSAMTVALCLDVYKLLREVALDNIDIESDAFKQQWQAIKCNYAEVYPMHCYVEQLIARRKGLRVELRNIYRSWVWALATPLRWIDDALRKRRHAQHLKNRAVTPHA